MRVLNLCTDRLFLLFKIWFPPPRPSFLVIFDRNLVSFTFVVGPKVHNHELASELLVVCVKANMRLERVNTLVEGISVQNSAMNCTFNVT